MTRRTMCVLAVAVVCVATAASARAGYVDAVLADSPFEYYRFQESNAVHGTTAVNSGTSGAAGMYILTGGDSTAGSFTNVTGMASDVTPGVQLDQSGRSGYGAQIAVGSQGSSYSGLSNFTVEFLLKPANYNAGSDGIKALYYTDGWYGGGTQLDLRGSVLHFGAEDATIAQTNANMDIGAAALTGKWSHVAITYSESGGSSLTTFYVNGNSLGSVTSNGVAADWSGGGYIGSWATGSRFYDGAIDEFAVYNRALSASDIQSHYSLVPEPSTVIMLATSLVSLIAYAWRKRK
jgi:hypothetical protein